MFKSMTDTKNLRSRSPKELKRSAPPTSSETVLQRTMAAQDDRIERTIAKLQL